MYSLFGRTITESENCFPFSGNTGIYGIVWVNWSSNNHQISKLSKSLFTLKIDEVKRASSNVFTHRNPALALLSVCESQRAQRS